MNIAELSIKFPTITWVFTLLLLGGGIVAYENLGRLEDPQFTVKNAQVFTTYPGATAQEVMEEVTDRVETAIQSLGQIKEVTSLSEPGKSTIMVEVHDNYDQATLPQVWDELRRKVSDVQRELPPGTQTSVVYDDFGDVFGVLYAVYGDGYSFAELKNHVDLLRKELLLVEDVGKITTWGEQQEVVYVELARARLAQLGIPSSRIYQTLEGENLVAPAGNVRVGDEYIRIQPSGEFTSVEDIGDILILAGDSAQPKLYLKDVATITRGYIDPPGRILRYNGHPAIGLAISTVQGGNVVNMGEAVKQRLAALEEQTPIGIELGVIALQSDSVTTAIQSFIVSLAQALAIVIGILMFAMGLRSGILIGVILLLTVLGTFIVMLINGVMLERISLGALIIALGMLVDNAIVVVEGILINQQRGMKPVEAAVNIVKQTMWPLFGATIVAILAFAAIGVSQDSTGEYCRSLFQVIMYSLTISWFLAITITPLFGVKFLKIKEVTEDSDPYGGLLFRVYRTALVGCIRYRWVTVAALVLMLALSIKGFGYVRQSFFPDSTRPQFLVHFWMPQGTHILRTESDANELAEFVRTLDGVTEVATFIGSGAPRFLLTYTPEDATSSYALLLPSVEDYNSIDTIMAKVQEHAAEAYPDAQVFSRRFMLGPGDAQKIQVRIRGPEADTLRWISAELQTEFTESRLVMDMQSDWRERVPVVRPLLADTPARDAGITRADVARTLQSTFSGLDVGVYREGDLLLPIRARAPESEYGDIDNINDVQIWSPVAQRSIPLQQVVSGFETRSENVRMRRKDRVSTITIKCDPAQGTASAAFAAVRPRIEERFDELATERNLIGYTLEWGGEYENSLEANENLAGKLPLTFLMMVVIVIVLFNSLRKPLIIFLTVPLSLIGVTAGLLLLDQPFGFMALLGLLSLSGMLIKNAIVLIDEINMQLTSGKEPYDAIVDSGVSRVRPVSMAALTTVLGMIPLLADAFFVAMAVTIMFGLAFATVLTLIVVPVLYAVFFRVPSPTAS